MSGGHFNYEENHLSYLVDSLRVVVESDTRPSEEARLLIPLLEILQHRIHAMDYYLEGDTGWDGYQEELTQEDEINLSALTNGIDMLTQCLKRGARRKAKYLEGQIAICEELKDTAVQEAADCERFLSDLKAPKIASAMLDAFALE